MKLIEQSFEILNQDLSELPSDIVVGPKIIREFLFENMLKQIELVGRVCYKSEDKIAPGTAQKFVNMLKEHAHGAMLEHGTIYLDRFISKRDCLDMGISEEWWEFYRKYVDNPYSKVVKLDTESGVHCYVTTNYRVIVENDWESDLEFMCESTIHHKKRITVKFVTDQGILREYTRHRTFSFAVESTRYCNYSKDKFGNELTYILPCWWKDEEGNEAEAEFCNSLQYAEEQYFFLLNQGWKPQQARNVLPMATKCEMVMTGFVDDWKHFFMLRCDPAAHPQAQELAVYLKRSFIEQGYVSAE